MRKASVETFIRRAALVAVVLVSAVVTIGACMSSNRDESPIYPPEREFDQTTAWELMHEAAAEAIADLPDFPGFEIRTVKLHYCEQFGETGEEYVSYDLAYEFSEEVSKDPLVRETYVDLLREKWNQAGYDIHRDEPSGTGKYYSIEATRPDGMNLYYRVAGLTVLHIQTGCIESVGGKDYYPPCLTPLGGVTEENDWATKFCSNIETVYPSEEATSEAVAPFESRPGVPIPFAADAARGERDGPTGGYEGLI